MGTTGLYLMQSSLRQREELFPVAETVSKRRVQKAVRKLYARYGEKIMAGIGSLECKEFWPEEESFSPLRNQTSTVSCGTRCRTWHGH